MEEPLFSGVCVSSTLGGTALQHPAPYSALSGAAVVAGGARALILRFRWGNAANFVAHADPKPCPTLRVIRPRLRRLRDIIYTLTLKRAVYGCKRPPTAPNASSERPGVQTSVFGVPDLVLDDVGLGGARFFRSFCQNKLRWHGFASPRALARRKLASSRLGH